MTSPAGRARRSWRCRSSKPTGRCARCRSASTSCTAPSRHERSAARARARSRAGRSGWLTRAGPRCCASYERRPIGPLRRLALGRAERWIVRRQEADGSWGGIQPPWVYSLMALHLGGYPLEHPVMRRGLEGLERFMVEDEDDARGVGRTAGASRRLEACQSPVWDTALAMIALADAGCPAMTRRWCAPREWLLGEEVTLPGDWAVGRPRPRARRLGVRVRQRQLSRCGRHRRGRACAAPRGRRDEAQPDGRNAASLDADRSGDRAGAALGRGHAERGRRLGRVRRRQHPLAGARAAVPATSAR